MITRPAVLLLLASLLLPGVSDAAKKDKRVDRIWTHPEIDSFGVGRIAMLPVTTFDNDLPSEKVVENHFAQALHTSGHRWISATTTREMLRSGGKDSVLNVARKTVLDTGRLDSLMAPGLCRTLRADAILAVRVDQWEKIELEPDQSGKPTTSIQLKASLVDSTGALLWSAAGSQTGEGAYHEAGAGAIGMTGGSLERKAVTGQGVAPSFPEVLTPLLARWAPLFPAKTTPGAAAADSTRASSPVPASKP